MSKRPKKQQPRSEIYGPDEPIESLDLQWIEDCNPVQFGSKFPDSGIFKKFSLGPWHELRRQMLLFTHHVAPADGEQVSPRRDPGPQIEERCDIWIVMFLKLVTEKKLIPPPKDLRRWLFARGLMALSFIDYEIRNQHKLTPPDMRNDFSAEIGSRLIDFWADEGKQRWIANDPGKTSTAE